MAVHATFHTGRILLFTLAIIVGIVIASPNGAGAQIRERIEASPEAEVDAAGVLGEFEYQSPQFGYTVEWAEPWVVDPAATESNIGIALDRLSLISGTARFQVFFVAAEGETAAEYAERFIDFRISYDPTTEIVTTGDRRGLTWIAYSFVSDGQQAVGVAEVSLSADGTAIQVVEVMDYDVTFEDAFDSASTGVELDGASPFRVLVEWPG